MEKLPLHMPPPEFIAALQDLERIAILLVDFSHAIGLASLPFHHRDPFDRLLIAQAQVENLPVMTSDLRFVDYDVGVVPASQEQQGPDVGRPEELHEPRLRSDIAASRHPELPLVPRPVPAIRRRRPPLGPTRDRTISQQKKSGRPGSNRRRPAWEAGILPLNYTRVRFSRSPLHEGGQPQPRPLVNGGRDGRLGQDGERERSTATVASWAAA